jgi:hypothetical protein
MFPQLVPFVKSSRLFCLALLSELLLINCATGAVQCLPHHAPESAAQGVPRALPPAADAATDQVCDPGCCIAEVSLQSVLGNRTRMMQACALSLLFALYVIWWRR